MNLAVMALNKSTILQIDATMIVGILIFLSFSSSLFQQLSPQTELERMKGTQIGRGFVEMAENGTLNLETLEKLNPMIVAMEDEFGIVPFLELVEMVENRNGIFTINETELLQEIETIVETGARSLQVMITIMTLVPFSASVLVIVLHSAITRQPELNERKYLRTSMLLDLLS